MGDFCLCVHNMHKVRMLQKKQLATFCTAAPTGGGGDNDSCFLTFLHCLLLIPVTVPQVLTPKGPFPAFTE